MSQTIEQLSKLSDDEIISLHDKAANNTVVGVQFYLDEINRREQNKQTKLMLKYTKYMLWLTILVTFLTIINLLALVFGLG